MSHPQSSNLASATNNAAKNVDSKCPLHVGVFVFASALCPSRAHAVPTRNTKLLKRERIRRQIYRTWLDARVDVFNCTEMFYNPKRRDNTSDGGPQVGFKKRQSQQIGSTK